jgi:hypothetical protein
MVKLMEKLPDEILRHLVSEWLQPLPRSILSDVFSSDCWFLPDFKDVSRLGDAISSDKELRTFEFLVDILSLTEHIQISCHGDLLKIENSIEKSTFKKHTTTVSISVQCRNRSHSEKLWKKAFVEKTAATVKERDDYQSLIFRNCSFDIESVVVRELKSSSLGGLIHISIYKDVGTVESGALKTAAKGGRKLKSLELMCDGVTRTVLTNLSDSQMENLMIIRLEICLDVNANVLQGFLAKVSPAIKHLELTHSTTMLSNYHLEFVVECVGKKLVMTGNLSWLWSYLENRHTPTWCNGLMSVHWDLKKEVSEHVFAKILGENSKHVQHLRINFQHSLIPTQSLCMTLKQLTRLRVLYLFQTRLNGLIHLTSSRGTVLGTSIFDQDSLPQKTDHLREQRFPDSDDLINIVSSCPDALDSLCIEF